MRARARRESAPVMSRCIGWVSGGVTGLGDTVEMYHRAREGATGWEIPHHPLAPSSPSRGVGRLGLLRGLGEEGDVSMVFVG